MSKIYIQRTRYSNYHNKIKGQGVTIKMQGIIMNLNSNDMHRTKIVLRTIRIEKETFELGND